MLRVRFAPNPGGRLHIGNARTAILNWIFARKNKGDFILRIEDTDPERANIDSEQAIYNDLQWLGLDWDEGPLKGGAYGPYRQSERCDIYKKTALEMMEKGKAYPCFCTPDELKKEREQQLVKKMTVKYSRRCVNLSKDERRELLRRNEPHVIRFLTPSREIKFYDLVMGEIVVSSEILSDMILIRSNGVATYNFANVVDDHLMNISHVIRGSDMLSNTHKQILLYNALDWEVPQFAHIPMITNMKGEKLSKRDGATSVQEYRENGYLPETLINFLSLLSWSSPSGKEVLSKAQLIEEFDFPRVNKSPAAFNIEKLNWMNSHYIRHIPIEKLSEFVRPYFERKNWSIPETSQFNKIVETTRGNFNVLKDAPEAAHFFFDDVPRLDDNSILEQLKASSAKVVLSKALEILQSQDLFSVQNFAMEINRFRKEKGMKTEEVMKPLRFALTGQEHGPMLDKVIDILGKEKCVKFIKYIMNRLE